MKRARQARKRAIRAASAEQHYIVVVKSKCACNACGGILRAGAEAVYRHTPREILCRVCSEERGLLPRPSRSWERRKLEEAKRRALKASNRSRVEGVVGAHLGSPSGGER
jgi:hypothetical protein